MKKYWFATLALLLAGSPASAQQRPGRAAQQPDRALQQQRIQLERQIMQRFAQQTGDELGLDNPGRRRLVQMLEASNARRRELTRQTNELRREMVRAIGDPATADTEFSRLLDRLNELREQDNAQWKADREAFARSLTPRQQAILMLRLANLQQRVQAMIEERAGGG